MAADTPRAILERARLRIFEPKHWSEFAALAVTERGEACDPRSPAAARWSAVGALHAESPSEGFACVAAAALLGRAAMDLYGANSVLISSYLGHCSALAIYDRALDLAAQAEAASGVGVAGASGGADDPADHVLGLDQGRRAADVRPVADEGRRASAQAFLEFLEYVSPELRLPLAERPGQRVEGGTEQKKRDAFSLRDHFIVFLHDRYSRIAAGENLDEAAPASSAPRPEPHPAVRERVAADLALAKARLAAARLTGLQHERGADTTDNALALMLAAVEAGRAYTAAANALRIRCERG